jgi:rare lipoprotein A
MNQRIWTGISATLLMTTLSTAASAQAEPTKTATQPSEGSSPVSQVRSASTTGIPTPEQPSIERQEVVKVGELQSSRATAVQQAEVIAKIHAYELGGRQAAVLYVRNIPVLTFLGSPATAQNSSPGAVAANPTKAASRAQGLPDKAPRLEPVEGTKQPSVALDGFEMDNNPVWRATTVAAKLNQMYRDNVDARAIGVRWNAQTRTYTIEANGREIVQVNEKTFLPDTTRNLGQDALQAANRLRRLMGNAPPLREIAGISKERRIARASLGPVRMEVTGMASWYGPGFHGNRSASGEVYNQNAMTAAHRTLPFGTNVIVTNLDNGRSVVVRINDRGPYVGGRVIDLSAAAARLLGIMDSGVAPVQLQVLGESQAAAPGNW